jgi:hypothetical protein
MPRSLTYLLKTTIAVVAIFLIASMGPLGIRFKGK